MPQITFQHGDVEQVVDVLGEGETIAIKRVKCLVDGVEVLEQQCSPDVSNQITEEHLRWELRRRGLS
jgi:hypothetical protein